MRRYHLAGAALAGAVFLAGEAAAQVPGLPVLQNAFSSAGLAFAANFGAGSGQSYYGVAAAWGLGADGRFLVSGAAGAQRIGNGGRGAYGARASMRLWNSAGGALGLSGFGGVGGAMRIRDAGVVTVPSVTLAPVGVSVGYRRAIGATRGISAYVSPFYRWARVDGATGTIESSGSFRFSGGVDFSFTPAIGVTVGGEAGGSGSGTGSFGAGLTFVPGGRRR